MILWRPRLSLLLLSSFLVGSWVVTVVDGAEHIDERAVLQEIYQAVGGKAWSNNYGWAENLPDVCEWAGVLCDRMMIQDLLQGLPVQDGSHTDRQRQRELQEFQESGFGDSKTKPITGQRLVLGLHLQGMDLAGRMPETLWTLPLLEFVDVSDNPALVMQFSAVEQADHLHTVKVAGTATDTITGISNAAATLKRLHVSGAPLESHIPAEIYELTTLQSLHMQNCALQGTIASDISQLSHLRFLNVAENSLTGTLPASFGEMVHLRILALSRNMFHGPLKDDTFADLVLMNEFYADHNQFDGPIPTFSSQPALRVIHLQNNLLTGRIPNDFLRGLVREEIAGSNGHGYVEVDLSNNHMTGVVNDEFALQDHLSHLPMLWYLVDNPITGTVPAALCDNVQWNANIGAVRGCRGFLCPAGTYSPVGHATVTQDCLTCPSVTTLGSTICLDQDDYSILKTLFLATGGDIDGTWIKTDGWLQDRDYCSWHGVTCSKRNDESDGRVVSLDLVHNGLVGTIPPTVFHLQYLRHLSVSRNDVVLPFDLIQDNQHISSISISNTLTTSFKGLEQVQHSGLHYLLADRLPIRGTLPSELLSVHTLRVLSLSECEIKGTLNTQIGAMGNLQELFLFDNQLQGSIPSHVGQLQKLRILSLAQNRFTGSLPSELERMPRLEALSIADQVTKGGGLIGTLPAFADAPTLTSLHLSDNVLQGEIPEHLLSRVNLDAPLTVTLANNRLAGKVPGSLAKFERLTIELEGNEITEVDYRLCNMDHWMGGLVAEYGCNAILCDADTAGGRQVYADAPCQVCPAAPNAGKNEQVEENWLGRAVCGLDDELSEHGVLQLLYKETGGVDWHVQDNWMSDEHYCTWTGITCDETLSVKGISLPSNQLLGDFPTEIYTLPKLEKLVIYNNKINFDFESIETAENLKTLILDSTGLRSLRGVGNAVGLEELSVRFNKLVGEMPQDISRLVNLRSLTISDNDITGDIPYWISTLSRLETFKGSFNLLSGKLYDFADMTQLKYLDLSNNKLEGPIPSTMLERASRTDKIVVDLEGNNLSGTIPIELTRFPFLSLHASRNKISGVATEVCNVETWNDNDVGAYGCDGILCPAGFANSVGRQTSHSNPCIKCSKAKYMGSTACSATPKSSSKSTAAAAAPYRMVAVGVVTVLSLVAMTIL